jgi:hypothetical protein
MPNRKSKPWTAEDDEKIRSFVAKGASAFRAGVALKRSRHAVYERARELGCPFPTIAQSRTKPSGTADNEWWGDRQAPGQTEEQ